MFVQVEVFSLFLVTCSSYFSTPSRSLLSKAVLWIEATDTVMAPVRYAYGLLDLAALANMLKDITPLDLMQMEMAVPMMVTIVLVADSLVLRATGLQTPGLHLVAIHGLLRVHLIQALLPKFLGSELWMLCKSLLAMVFGVGVLLVKMGCFVVLVVLGFLVGVFGPLLLESPGRLLAMVFGIVLLTMMVFGLLLAMVFGILLLAVLVAGIAHLLVVWIVGFLVMVPGLVLASGFLSPRRRCFPLWLR